MVMKTRIENDSHILKDVTGALMDVLRQKGVAEGTIFDVHVGFEEALRNAMVHGNKNDPAKKVTVETEVRDDRVTISVEDEGEGFDPGTVANPTLDENLLKEGGRGVYLITHLMDEVSYENGGRKVVMVKYLSGKEQ